MDLEYHDGAEDDLESFSEEVEDQIREKISELQEQMTSHPDVKLIQIEGTPVFRLKIGERNHKIDHRAIFDIKGSRILVLAVIHRDEGYSTVSI